MDFLTIGAVFVGAVGVSATIMLLLERPKLKRAPDPRTLTLMKQMGELRIEVADLRDLYERLMKSHRRLRSSAGMAKLRGMDEQPAMANKSEAEILAELNLQRRRTS